MIAIYLRKEQELDADPKANQQVNLTADLDQDDDTTMLFINEERKETFQKFSEGTVKVL